MFSRISRYRGLPDEATRDARGRVLAWKSLRLLPDAPGTFLHTVQETDRLDHLAYRYYDQPRDWWRIADANPGFLHPLALLGQEPRATLRIPAAWEGPEAPWPALVAALRGVPGVERAAAGTPERPHAVTRVVEGPPLADLAAGLAPALDDAAAAQLLPAAVLAALLAEGVDLPPAVRVAKPDAVTWVLADAAPPRAFTLRLFPDEGVLRLFGSDFLHEWVVEARYDTTALAAADLLARVEGAGFRAGPPEAVGRVGKPVVVPPRRG
ncbi:MAG TPA: hypothetical protein VHG51_01105 [Longimicrobiaceae bacterium]|nr:hypothetical protein [Longimicrobiaceae bacterium]